MRPNIANNINGLASPLVNLLRNALGMSYVPVPRDEAAALEDMGWRDDTSPEQREVW